MTRTIAAVALLSGLLALSVGCGEGGNPPGKPPDTPVPIIKDGPKVGGAPPPIKAKDSKKDTGVAQ